MTTNIGWHHPVDAADQWDGFNELGMQHFAGNPTRHLAREVIQNALDAHTSDTVIVKIKLHQVPVSDIPNLDELKANISSCNSASHAEGKKAEIFFQQAQKELEQSSIQVLEIADYNTFGMKGPSENGTPFYAFMKAKGQSKKTTATASGSYGIGKFAPYLVSKIRTIFVSTIYQSESGETSQLTQGKSILMSHDKDGLRMQGIGFWGIKEKCQPIVNDDVSLPEWITRAQESSQYGERVGTKLSIMCFDAQKNWETMLAVSVAENFFAAIWDGKLKVEIDGKYTLEKSTIADIYSDEQFATIKQVILGQKNEPDQFLNTKAYLTAHQKGLEVFTKQSQTRYLGLCEVKIWVAEELPKKVCILRNGMFITDSLAGLKMFSDFKEFVAVFYCLDKAGAELLRSMEPPKHDDFEVDLLPTKEEQAKGKKALSEIAQFVRDALRQFAKDPVSDVTEIDELKDFFGEEGNGDTGKGTEEINPYGEVVIRGKPIKSKTQSVDNSGDTGEGGTDDGQNDGGGGADGAGKGDGLGGNGAGSGGSSNGGEKSFVEIANIRAPFMAGLVRKVSFTPLKSGTIGILVKEAGADVDYDVEITKASLGTLKSGGVVIDAISGMRVSIDLELKQNYTGALKVVAYEI